MLPIMVENINVAINKHSFSTLLIASILLFFAWYMQYHWRRRRLYLLAAKQDGPLTLPFIGSALCFLGSTSDILDNFMRVVKDYRTPVRIWLGQRLFFFIWHPKDLKVIMNSPHALQKDELYKYAEIGVGTGLFSAPVPKWKRHRKIIMPTFNQKLLDGFVGIFAEKSDILVKQLEKKVGQGTFNIFDPISKCSLDIICEAVMGVTVNAQIQDSDYMKWANRAMEIIYIRMFNIFYHYDFIFNLTSISKELKEVTASMHKFSTTVLREKRIAYQKEKQNTSEVYEEEILKRKTLLQLLIELSEEGACFTDEEILDEVKTFIIAGSDSTASINSFAMVMLGMHPNIQDKVYNEVIDMLGQEKPVEPEDLRKFQYLERVIKETMRLFPVGPALVRAINKDIELDKGTIPKGSSVAFSIITLHRSEEYWPDPLKFDPDRFLPENVDKRHPYTWVPFSGGPRNCIGIKYAMMVMKALIATVIRRFKMSTEYKNVEDIKLKADLILKPVDGYKLSIEFRGCNH